MTALRDTLAAEALPLVVIVLPFRAALDTAEPRATPSWRVHERMLAELRALGVRAIDAWPPFLDRATGGRSPEWFVSTPSYDCHFNERGHALYAFWLRDQVGDVFSR